MMVPAFETDVSATVPTAPAMNDLPDLVDTFSANPAPHQSGPDLPSVMPPPDAVPNIDAGPAISSYPAFDAPNVGTLPPIIQVPREAPPVPTLPALAGIVATAAFVATPPRLVSVGKASRQTAPLPRPARLEAPAPIMMVPPKAMNVGTAPPRIAQIGKLHAILAPVPAFPAPPALLAVGDRLPVMQGPPVLRHIGHQAPRLRNPLVTIWDIGPAMVTDAGDDAVEAQLKAAVEAIVAAREATAAQSFDPVASAMVPQRRSADKPALSEAARAVALEVLRLRDDWVRYDEQGYYTCSDEALGAADLTRADIMTPAAQAAIKAIGENQVDRFDPVFDEPSVRSPFRLDRGALRLDLRFAAKLQTDVTRWSSDPGFQSFVARIWPLTFTDRVAAPDPLTPASGAQPQSPAQAAASLIDPWMQAAAIRQRAMAEWDEIERSDGVGMVRPGRILTRPGKSASLNALPSTPQDRTPVRLHPGMFPGGGGSIGG